ncbi:MAG: cytochrome c [Acidobacteriota bacterium]|nr:cytochrome c [Acidobacteriota bacterium]
MAKTAKRGGGSGLGRVFLGFLLGIVFLAVGLFLYLKFGPLPVAVADTPFPFEKQIVHLPLNARIDRDMKTAPFGISEDVFEAGAHVYRAQCASCHGTPGRDVPYARYMYPSAPQLWKKHGTHGVVGVSDDEAGETYWKVANGIRLSGMPAYNHVLTDTQMWQVSLLLKNADKELPGPVSQILAAPPPSPQ